jgi:hypothetical protein
LGSAEPTKEFGRLFLGIIVYINIKPGEILWGASNKTGLYGWFLNFVHSEIIEYKTYFESRRENGT